jgi:hypothetical protein
MKMDKLFGGVFPILAILNVFQRGELLCWKQKKMEGNLGVDQKSIEAETKQPILPAQQSNSPAGEAQQSGGLISSRVRTRARGRAGVEGRQASCWRGCNFPQNDPKPQQKALPFPHARPAESLAGRRRRRRLLCPSAPRARDAAPTNANSPPS